MSKGSDLSVLTPTGETVPYEAQRVKWGLSYGRKSLIRMDFLPPYEVR